MRPRSSRSRRLTLPALLTALALVATACGDGATELVEDADDTGDATEETTDTEAADDEAAVPRVSPSMMAPWFGTDQ